MNSRTSTLRKQLAHGLGLAAAASLMGGLLVPVSAAQAGVPAAAPAAPAALPTAFGKPTSVNAKAVSGSNGLRVTWKAPSGKPAAYKVSWGTSSSATKAKYATYVTGTATYISSASMATKTYYYVWVQPWSKASSTGTATGSRSSADKAKTSSYAYKAPAKIKAVNATKTSVEITWRTVTGSPGYVLRAYNYTTKSYRYQIGFDGSAIFTGLTPNTKYKFTVANRLLTSSYTTVPGLRMSGWSSASSTMSTNATAALVPQANGTKTPVPMRDIPTELKMTNRDSSSVTLSWKPPAGYTSATDTFRVYWAEDQEMTDNDGYTKTPLAGTSGRVKGLSPNTNYYVRIRMVRSSVVNGVTVVTGISDRTQAVMVKTRSPKGVLTGKVTGVDGSNLADYVAVAYGKSGTKPGDVKGVADVSSSGDYRLELRPGTYFIQFSYVGAGNFTTQWYTNNGTRAYASADSKTALAVLDKTSSLATVQVGIGASVTGRVTNTSGTGLRDVFISARTAWSGSREVVAQATTNSTGYYQLVGLPPGKTVYVRADGAILGYGRKSTGAATVSAAGKSHVIGTLKLSKS